MSDQESQEDELLALASIYDASIFESSTEGERPGGQFSAHLDLPQPFSIKLPSTNKDSQNKDGLHQVKFLPPIMLFFELPLDYPSKQQPTFTLSCKWLTLKQLSSLCQRLDEIWEENLGEVVLFMWTGFLKDEALEYLGIQSPLDLSDVVSKHKHSRLSRQNSKQQGEENCDSNKTTEISEADNKSASNEGAAALNFDPRAVQDIGSQGLLLASLIEHDKLQKEMEFRTTLFTCQVCFMEKLGILCLSFPGCGHVYCKDCMKGYFEVQIMDGNVKGLTCPYHECESQAHPAQVKELLTQELFQRYDRLLLQSSLDTMSDVVYCPRRDCGTPVMMDLESNMGSCPACRFAFCMYCKMVYHGVSPCRIKSEEATKLVVTYNNATPEGKLKLEQRYGKKMIQRILEESSSKVWLDQYSKQCPHCSTHIQKIDGCNKMACTKCRSFFCWLCNKMLPKNNPYSHFNQPQSECFNRLFQGVIMNEEGEEFDEDEDFYDIPAEAIDWI